MSTGSRAAQTRAIVTYLLARPHDSEVGAAVIAHDLQFPLSAVVVVLHRLRLAGWVVSRDGGPPVERRPVEWARCYYSLTVAGRTRATNLLGAPGLADPRSAPSPAGHVPRTAW